MDLANIKEEIERLSIKERSELFQFIADLPGSGIKTVSPPGLGRNNDKPVESKNEASLGFKGQPEIAFNYSCRLEDGSVLYLLEGVEIFRARFDVENCVNVFFEKLKPKDPYLNISSRQRESIYQAVRELLTVERPGITDEEIQTYEKQALHLMGLDLLKESIEHSAKQVNENLPRAVALVFNKILQAAHFALANDLRDTLNVPEQKYSAKKIKESLFNEDWEHFKIIAGVSQGGARNVKHGWNDKERSCLANQYEQLKPIWLEAKRISKQARNSKESARRNKWQESVLSVYADLPIDLVELLAAARSDESRPADLALIHAARICIPGISYSTRQLRSEIKRWKLNQ